MNKVSLIDYWGYILCRLLGPLIRNLPKNFALFLGRRLGELLYTFDSRHKSLAYGNIKTALGNKLTPAKLAYLTREFYKSFGQNLIEIFFIPLVNKDYIDKYISIEGLDYIIEGFKRGKGVILLGIHEGSWELSNIICAKLDFPFLLFVGEQRYPHLNQLLNFYRRQQGCKIVEREEQKRKIIQVFKDNQAIGMSVDQGGKTGIPVKFFGKDASMASGAIRLALKYDTTLLPVFYQRIKGPYIKVIIEPPFQLKRTGNLQEDIHDNLQEIVHIFEKYLLKYPQEYLWTYKIWKYGQEKNILILSDDKVGHLRQAETVANMLGNLLKDKGIKAEIDMHEVKFKSQFNQRALSLSCFLSHKYICQGCLWCLRTFLEKDSYKSLIGLRSDFIISCGSSLAPINFVLSQENQAKSIVILRPSILSTKRFDLVIMPKHDKPARRKNVVVTEGALNLIDEDCLREQSEKLRITDYGLRITSFCIGLLIGGNTKRFHLKEDIVLEVIRQIKSISKRLNADILVTTSRRTSQGIERIVKEEFKGYSLCKLMIIANEKNIPEAMGGILGLSQIVVVSSESISMISEAVNSKKYVLVFNSDGLSKKHQRFLEYFARNKYIYIIEPQNLAKTIEDIWQNKPQIHTLKDNLLVSQAIKEIL